MKKMKLFKCFSISFTVLLGVGALVNASIKDGNNYVATRAVELVGEGTRENPYRINNKADLETFRDIVNGTGGQTQNKGACATLLADIDLEGSSTNKWSPFVSYEGLLNGNYHTISGLYMNDDETDNMGFISVIERAGKVKNLTVDGEFTNTKDTYSTYTGAICGTNKGTIYNCSNLASVTAIRHAGGLVGNNELAINKSSNKGTVVTTGDDYAGGIAARNASGSIYHCYNDGPVTCKGRNVGGIVGICSGSIWYSHNYASITSLSTYETKYLGAIVGDGSAGLIYGNYYLDGTAPLGDGDENPDKSDEVKKLSASEFTNVESFSYWDFDIIWEMGVKYPVFIDYFGVYVGNDFVTKDRKSGEGWSYDEVTGVLTLNNFTYNGVGTRGTYHGVISYFESDFLSIVLNGENVITSESNEVGEYTCVFSSNDLIISGEGKLSLTLSGYSDSYSSSTALYSQRDFTLNSGSIVAKTSRHSNSHQNSGLAVSKKVNLNGGSLYAEGYNYGMMLTGDGNKVIGNNIKLFEAVGYGIDASKAIFGYDDPLVPSYDGKAWTDAEGTTGEVTLTANTEYNIYDGLKDYKRIKFYIPEPTPPEPTPTPTPTPTPDPDDPVNPDTPSGSGLGAGAIVGIILGSVAVALGLGYLAIFFLFNKWIKVDDKAVRVFKLGQKDGKTRLLRMPFKFEYRDIKEVFNTKSDALK